MRSLVPLILGSAAVGALVSSIVTLVGQSIERKARQKELLLSKAIELAELQIDMQKAAVEMNGGRVEVYPHIVQARWFHKELVKLLSDGKLSQGMERKYGDYFDSPGSKN